MREESNRYSVRHNVLVVVVGPTAIGKTRWAISLARHYGTEIISADSRQFFREMSIGTAVPSQKELQMVPHHLIQHKSIQGPYSVGDFERDALLVLNRLFETNDTVILVGGSGLYVDAVTQGLDAFPDIAPGIREGLMQQLESQGIEVLQNQLQKLDPGYFAQVDRANPHRLVRALEVSLSSGRPYSTYLDKPRPERPFATITIGLEADRELVYRRIEDRVDAMVNAGLVDEARSLYPHRALNALQTVGYRELFAYFNGEIPLDTAIDEIKKNSRRFAKRQFTWFRRDPGTLWIPYDSTLAQVTPLIDDRIKLVR